MGRRVEEYIGVKAVFCLLNADKVVLDGVGKKGYNFLV